MKSLLQTPPRRLLIFAGLLLILSAVLLFSARDVVRELIVIPLSYLFYSARLILYTTPEIFFWIIVLVLTGMIAYRSLYPQRKKLALSPPELLELPMTNEGANGRVSYWTTKVDLYRKHTVDFQGSFGQSLSRFLIDLIGFRYHLPHNLVEQRIREGTLDTPDEIRQYILNGLKPLDGSNDRFWVRLWKAIRGFLGGIARPRLNEPLGALRPNTARILEYIEEELEVTHDDTGR